MAHEIMTLAPLKKYAEITGSQNLSKDWFIAVLSIPIPSPSLYDKTYYLIDAIMLLYYVKQRLLHYINTIQATHSKSTSSTTAATKNVLNVLYTMYNAAIHKIEAMWVVLHVIPK
jgi:hypothetical protein